MIHVIGAGLAGLSCALALAESGRAVTVHEAAPQAGGRCRSFFDPLLQRTVDNGSHMLLSGNRAALGFIERIGARGEWSEMAPAAFPFLDLGSGRRWTLRPNRGVVPWWLLMPSRRVPGTRATDYLAARRLAAGGTVAERVGIGTVAERLWRPLCEAALNTAPAEASAALMWQVLRQTLLAGEASSRPLLARAGLSEALVAPALRTLQATGVQVRLNSRLRGLDLAGGRVTALHFPGGALPLAQDEAVVLAVPPWAAAELLPGLPSFACSTIVNGHCRLAASPPEAPAPALLGLVGGTAQWLFVRGDVVSITVSAADALADARSEEIAALLWTDAARALGVSASAPPARIVKERRATIRQTPAQERLRPSPATDWRNLWLAGDWTATGLPATIEGSVRSGHAAAALVAAALP